MIISGLKQFLMVGVVVSVGISAYHMGYCVTIGETNQETCTDVSQEDVDAWQAHGDVDVIDFERGRSAHEAEEGEL